MTPEKKLPLNCPYCDEPAYRKLHSNRFVRPHKIYTLRQCPMGHTFYTTEEISEDQEEVEQEIADIKAERRRELDHARHQRNKRIAKAEQLL